MDLFVWILVGSLVGWVGYARFNFNESRGRNVSIILGAAGALIGAKMIAPMFVVMPAGEFNAPGVFIAAGAATVVLLLIAVTVLTAAHMLEVGVWAVFFDVMGVAPQGDIAVYDFAFENYVALGYGDAVPPPDKRLYAPLSSLNGLLLIGWSVAIIFEVLRMAEVRITHRRHRRTS